MPFHYHRFELLDVVYCIIHDHDDINPNDSMALFIIKDLDDSKIYVVHQAYCLNAIINKIFNNINVIVQNSNNGNENRVGVCAQGDLWIEKEDKNTLYRYKNYFNKNLQHINQTLSLTTIDNAAFIKGVIKFDDIN